MSLLRYFNGSAFLYHPGTSFACASAAVRPEAFIYEAETEGNGVRFIVKRFKFQGREESFY